MTCGMIMCRMGNVFGSSAVLSGCTPTLFNDESPSLDCATQMIPTIRAELNSTKWKDLIVGVGQVFPSADVLRKTLYKYSFAHNFALGNTCRVFC